MDSTSRTTGRHVCRLAGSRWKTSRRSCGSQAGPLTGYLEQALRVRGQHAPPTSTLAVSPKRDLIGCSESAARGLPSTKYDQTQPARATLGQAPGKSATTPSAAALVLPPAPPFRCLLPSPGSCSRVLHAAGFRVTPLVRLSGLLDARKCLLLPSSPPPTSPLAEISPSTVQQRT